MPINLQHECAMPTPFPAARLCNDCHRCRCLGYRPSIQCLQYRKRLLLLFSFYFCFVFNGLNRFLGNDYLIRFWISDVSTFLCLIIIPEKTLLFFSDIHFNKSTTTTKRFCFFQIVFHFFMNLFFLLHWG